jgi:hypothetical protein
MRNHHTATAPDSSRNCLAYWTALVPFVFLWLGAAIPAHGNLLPNVVDQYHVVEIPLPAEYPVVFRAQIGNSGLLVAEVWNPATSTSADAAYKKGEWRILPPEFVALGQPTAQDNIPGQVQVTVGPQVVIRAAYYSWAENVKRDRIVRLPFAGAILGLLENGTMLADTPGGMEVMDKHLRIYSAVQPLRAFETWPYALNNKRWVVGRYQWEPFTFGAIMGYVYKGGNDFTYVSLPNANVWLNTINNAGDMGGYYESMEEGHGLLVKKKGEMFGFYIPGSEWTTIDAITEDGRLSGTFSMGNERKIFVAIPGRP